MKRNLQATEAAHFIDDRSYIAPDGREILYRDDWAYRKHELWQRAGGRCEQITSDGSRCRSEGHDPDHIIRRRVRGSCTRDDRLSNLQLLCRMHHELKHPEKQLKSGKLTKPLTTEQILGMEPR